MHTPARKNVDTMRGNESSVEQAKVKILDVQVLADDWHVLRKTTFEYRRNDGTTTIEHRETYDRGNGAAILLYDAARRCVLLVRQFRYPVFVNGHPNGMLLEVPAGLLDHDDPETAIRREATEETGVQLTSITHVFTSFMSPGSVTESLHFYAAPYTTADRTDKGGGIAAEGEDLEVIEIPFDEAYAGIWNGTITDAKTIMLLQWAILRGPFHQG